MPAGPPQYISGPRARSAARHSSSPANPRVVVVKWFGLFGV